MGEWQRDKSSEVTAVPHPPYLWGLRSKASGCLRTWMAPNRLYVFPTHTHYDKVEFTI